MGFTWFCWWYDGVRRTSAFILLVFGAQVAIAQTFVYRGHFKSPQNLVLNVREGEIRMNNQSYGQPVLFTVRDHQIYKQQSYSLLDILFTNRDGYFYLGYSDNPFDIIYNFDGEKFYFRDRRYALDIAYTAYLNGIYPGPSTFINDVLFTIEGPYTDTELFAIIFALGLL